MRKIQIEFMGRHVRAFGHEAHVAECAGVDDGFKIGAIDGVELTTLRAVNQIKQARETVAQVEAPPAAMTDVEDAT